MSESRRSSFTIAGGLLLLTAVAYLGLVALAVPTGRTYLTVLGGNESTSLGALVAVYGTLAIVALVVARQILAGHISPVVIGGFVVWFMVTALSAVLIAPLVAVTIALTGLVPLVLVLYGERAAR